MVKPDERLGRGEDSFAAAVEEERVTDTVEGAVMGICERRILRF